MGMRVKHIHSHSHLHKVKRKTKTKKKPKLNGTVTFVQVSPLDSQQTTWSNPGSSATSYEGTSNESEPFYMCRSYYCVEPSSFPNITISSTGNIAQVLNNWFPGLSFKEQLLAIPPALYNPPRTVSNGIRHQSWTSGGYIYHHEGNNTWWTIDIVGNQTTTVVITFQ